MEFLARREVGRFLQHTKVQLPSSDFIYSLRNKSKKRSALLRNLKRLRGNWLILHWGKKSPVNYYFLFIALGSKVTYCQSRVSYSGILCVLHLTLLLQLGHLPKLRGLVEVCANPNPILNKEVKLCAGLNPEG